MTTLTSAPVMETDCSADCLETVGIKAHDGGAILVITEDCPVHGIEAAIIAAIEAGEVTDLAGLPA
jgi:hypothetical protein